MLKVNKHQLEALKNIYGSNLEVVQAKHSLFIVGNVAQLEAYRRFIEGQPSNRQRKDMARAEGK